MEVIHSRISSESKRHLQTIAKENNESMNGIVNIAIERYIADYFSKSESKKAIPQLEKVLEEHLTDFSTHIRTLIARGVLDNAVSMLGVVDLISNETGQSQSEVYKMYRELAYTRVKDRHELFKDLDTLYKLKKELSNDE
ncbi:hypothetical protein K0T63_002510 [Staphylococcus pseudintermedius]|uniref:hypothetical protein n=1 Tax=Staphylococcus pseudintermedius TaxID=283734 RepID=UPI0019326920|nr:hypothetical protein [Staphylococcus pseudintermedius]EGQ3202926.1 hypothetical protein [Staphylococcus pseudintermedius]EGQ4248655.1 hypothetical protein [Staphylococcus pseudintermedius]EHV5281316.1 hypothetical protein [Staphylococcus pseudintermedius]EHV5288322.1 hypothetical protein [Staphylococcus pseudintermedius]ELJ9269285.1 hypothetical protein [Staphylococcus pseudintermedius]